MVEWYDFGPRDWAHVRSGALGLLLGTIVPVGGFYFAYRLLTFEVAVIAVLAWALCFFVWHLWHYRKADVFSLTTMVMACVKATAGLVSGNLTLYLVWPSVENVLYGTAFLTSAILGRPILGMYAQRLYPFSEDLTKSPTFRRAFLHVSIAWAAVSLCRATLRVWLVSTLPLPVFLLVDAVSGWPAYALLMWFTAWYPLCLLRREGHLLP